MSYKYFVYKITNLVNGKLYVGKSQHDLLCGSTRWEIHLKVAKGGKEKYPRSFSTIHKAIRKYSPKNFTYEIVKEFTTESSALKAETSLISKLRKSGYILYNLTDGGDGLSGFTHSKMSRQKISSSQQGEKSSNAKLTEANVISIKQFVRDGIPRSEIAKQFNVSLSTIAMIIQGRRWAHIP